MRNYDAFGRKRGEDPLSKMGWRPRERRIGLAVALLAFVIVIAAVGVAAALLTTG